MRLMLIALLVLLPLAVTAQTAPEAPTSAPATMTAPPAVPGGLPVQLAMRWIHVLTAVLLVGGTLFMRFVLLPAAKATLDDDTHQKLRGAIVSRWKKVVHTGILLFLVSGFFNYLFVTRFQHQDPAYHMMFGIKFLLALAVFALAILLTSQKGYAAGIRAKAPFWMGVLAALGVLVVMLGGYMKALH